MQKLILNKVILFSWIFVIFLIASPKLVSAQIKDLAWPLVNKNINNIHLFHGYDDAVQVDEKKMELTAVTMAHFQNT